MCVLIFCVIFRLKTADEQAATEPKHVPEHEQEHSVPTPPILISEENNEEVANPVNNTEEVKNLSKSNGDVVENSKGNNSNGPIFHFSSLNS
jgi:hypothetical protein